MRKPNNWENVKESVEFEKLPLGAYVCKILQASVADLRNGGQQLAVLFDISEGEWAKFFTEDFNAQKQSSKFDPKWKGVLRLFLPNEDGSENDEWTKSTLKGFINAVEASNQGFTFDWDERTLKGKYIGIIFRNEEWQNSESGNTGWSVRPFKGISVSKVRSGDYKLPNDKPLKNKVSSSVAPTFTEEDCGDGDLPWN